MKAKDLMIPMADFLAPGNTVEEAVNLLLKARRSDECVGVKGLPVLDTSGQLAGMLTMRDILKAIIPSYMGFMNLGDFTWDGMLEAMAAKVAHRKVEEIMTTDVMTVHEDSPLMECVDHMIKGNFKRLPVVDGKNRVIGMLYEKDIFCAITRAMHREPPGVKK